MHGEKGLVHSFQSLGTVDGPGVRFVVFMAGCALRCGCCHNPDTWDMSAGTPYTAEEIVARAERYREYYGKDGGITVSGGEPLLQADFVRRLFSLCHERGLHTCLDTSGSVLDDGVLALLDECDRVLLDLKYTNDADYRAYVGCGIDTPLRFLRALDERHIPTTVRQVIIPTLNDTEGGVRELKRLTAPYKCVTGIELLPFRKLCSVKYEQMGLSFPFGHLPEPAREKMAALEAVLAEGGAFC